MIGSKTLWTELPLGKCKWQSLLVSVLLALSLTVGSRGETKEKLPQNNLPPTAKQTSNKVTIATKEKKTPRNFKARLIDKPPVLARLPQYPGRGAAFVRGTDLVDTSKGHCYSLRYVAKENISDVADWYKGALEDYGWKVKVYPKNNKKGLLVATDPENGLCCQVRVQPSRRTGYRSAIMLRYGDIPIISKDGSKKKTPAKLGSVQTNSNTAGSTR